MSWIKRYEASIGSTLARLNDVVAVRGEGSWIVADDKRRYLDFACGIATTSLGHAHPAVVKAVAEQAAALMHTSVVVRNTPVVECAEMLMARTPFINDPRVFFQNSGTEAVEAALKLARKTTGRSGIIAFEGGFHGRTMGSVSLTTAKMKYRDGYGPLVGDVWIAPFANPLGVGPERATADALAGLDAVLAAATAPIAAMIVEPVLGEAGYVVPPVAWLHALRERCDRLGALLVFDEVQTGAGRTGHYFAAETFGVAPDVVLFAKGVANGLPLGGLIASNEIFSRWPVASHGTTFGGNPVCCAAAVATMLALDREDILGRVRTKGPSLLEGLSNKIGANALDVRGIGYMFGLELGDAKEVADARARCLQEGVIVISCGPSDSVLRVIPPLNATDEELELGFDVIARSI